MAVALHFWKPANDIKSQLEISFGGLGHPGLRDREDVAMGVVVIQIVAKGLMVQVLLLLM